MIGVGPSSRGLSPARRLEVSPLAYDDAAEALAFTLRRFGARQQKAYAARIEETLRWLQVSPEEPPARVEPELTRTIGHASAVWSRHLGRRARHRWYYRVVDDGGAEVVQVARLLHDAMEPTRHVGEGFDDLSA